MRVTVKATQIELTPAISDYVDKKVQMLDKLVDVNDTSAICDVEVGKPSRHHQSGDVFYAEFNVSIAGARFRATAEEGSLYAAIDKAKDDVVREMKRHKRKQIHMLRRGGAKLKEITRGISERGVRLKGYIIRSKGK